MDLSPLTCEDEQLMTAKEVEVVVGSSWINENPDVVNNRYKVKWMMGVDEEDIREVGHAKGRTK